MVAAADRRVNGGNMNLLVSNDDGIDAPGIAALAEALSDLGTVWVVAPSSERSAQSHALTMHKPLRVHQRKERWFSVSGTPADCAYMAVHHLLPEPPALMISGINRGSNLGNDIFYSGTFAAALEASFQGVAAVAVSLHAPHPRAHWETAQHVVRQLVPKILAEPWPRRVLFNVNVPNIPLHELKGIRAARLGERRYDSMVDRRTDPRGREYFWIGGEHAEFLGDEHTDGPAVLAGWAAVTPVFPDLTVESLLPRIDRWFQGAP